MLRRTSTALAHRRRGAAVLEDRGEGLVPAQGHRGLRGSQPGTEGVLGEPPRGPERIGNCSNDLESVRINLGGEGGIRTLGDVATTPDFESR